MTIYSNRLRGGVQIKIINVNDNEFGSQGGNNAVDEDFAVVKPAVQVDLSPGYSIWSPPTVNLVRSFFLLVVLYVHYKRAIRHFSTLWDI
jgi:hypothetical protein